MRMLTFCTRRGMPPPAARQPSRHASGLQAEGLKRQQSSKSYPSDVWDRCRYCCFFGLRCRGTYTGFRDPSASQNEQSETFSFGMPHTKLSPNAWARSDRPHLSGLEASIFFFIVGYIYLEVYVIYMMFDRSFRCKTLKTRCTNCAHGPKALKAINPATAIEQAELSWCAGCSLEQILRSGI